MNFSCEITTLWRIIGFQDLQHRVRNRGQVEKLTLQVLNNLQTGYCGQNIFLSQCSFKFNCMCRPWDCAPKGCYQDWSLLTCISEIKKSMLTDLNPSNFQKDDWYWNKTPKNLRNDFIIYNNYFFTLRNLAASIHIDPFDPIHPDTAAPAVYSKNVDDEMWEDGIVWRETEPVSNRFPREIPDPPAGAQMWGGW